MSEARKPHSVSVAEVAEMAYAHAKKAWWANAVTDLGEPLGDYPAQAFNEGLEELKAAFASLEEQLEAAQALCRELYGVFYPHLDESERVRLRALIYGDASSPAKRQV